MFTEPQTPFQVLGPAPAEITRRGGRTKKWAGGEGELLGRDETENGGSGLRGVREQCSRQEDSQDKGSEAAVGEREGREEAGRCWQQARGKVLQSFVSLHEQGATAGSLAEEGQDVITMSEDSSGRYTDSEVAAALAQVSMSVTDRGKEQGCEDGSDSGGALIV